MKPRLALALAVGSALVLVALAARGTSPVTYVDRGGGGGDDTPTPTPPSRSPVPLGDVEGSAAAGSFLVFVLVVVVVAVVGVLAVLLYAFAEARRRRRRATGRGVENPEFDEGHAAPPEILVRRAAEALRELRERGDGPPGDAVIAAWLSLERAAGDSGLPRQGHQTSTEFTGDLLARYRVDEAATAALRRAYQRARFGTAAVTRDDARAATEALETIVRGLR
ncbi:DUF4129 domain-containing protein [Saccharothrix sp. BKS2]|uniref:DUF4129 domain-containing protein n=1 Tax=Saccharothrix sp. BKS2 TaxID=3064400 RepID=UPI0039ED5E3F